MRAHAPRPLPISPPLDPCLHRSRRSNYGITTNSRIEWLFVVGTDATPEQLLQLERWPEESVEKLRDRSRARVKPVLAELEQKAKPFNVQLVETGNTELLRDELIAANLYTGPVRCLGPWPAPPLSPSTPHA